MAIVDFVQRHGRKLVVAATIAGTLALGTTPQPAQARGEGVALGVVGGVVAGAAIAGAAANAYNPYYPYAGYYAPPPPAYYPPAYAPRSCWDPYYRRYYAC